MGHRSWRREIGALLSAGVLLAGVSSDISAEEARFVFIGDMPYSDGERERLTGVIAEGLRSGGFPFLVHYGDLKGGGVACGGEGAVRDVYAEITGLMGDGAGPVFYTPGDNDWTDCDREFKTGKPLSELASLDLIRQVFFRENPLDLGDSWRYARQPLYPENALWRSASVQFGTVHLVGTNNGRIQIRMDDVAVALAQVDARDQANRAWLNRIFGAASNFRNPASAVIIATQADVTNPSEHAACSPANPMYCDAFAGFRAQLRKHAAAFGKPVLLVHGDTGPYCMDRAFGGPEAPRLWRLNAGGDFHKPQDATVVSFDSSSESSPFSVSGLIEGEGPEDGC